MFAWGLASQGGLGFDSDLDVSVQEPIPIDTLKDATEIDLIKVLQVKSGENHTLALIQMMTDDCKQKVVWAWGANDRR